MMHLRRSRPIEERVRLFAEIRRGGDQQCDHKHQILQRKQKTQLQAQISDSDEESSSSSSLTEILLIVLPLLLIYISNQWSRYSISYLVDFGTSSSISPYEAMNVDLSFTQSQYGLLASTAFTVLFAISSLFAGNLADRYDRKLLTLGSCAVWTLATLATSQAHSYNEVLAARVIMGGACAFAVPAAYTLIAEKVSKDKLALSNSIYGSGVYLGGALSSLSLLLDESVGWRGTLGAIGAFGVISAATAGLLLPADGDRAVKRVGEDTDSSTSKETEENSLVQNTQQILSIPRVQFLFLASFLRFCSGLMIGVWAAPYYKQAFPDNASEYAVVNAFIVGAMGMSSGILGGYIADGLGTWIKEAKDESSGAVSNIVRGYFDEQSIPLLLPIVGSSLAIPAWYLTTHTGASDDAFKLAMFWLAVEYLVAECWFGPTIAVLQSTVGDTRRGTAQGLFVLTGAVGNLAPTLLGWIYGNQITGDSAASSSSSSEVLANLLGWGVCTGYFLSAIFFAVSVRASGDSMERSSKQI
eukprot:CAMPEP_0183714106 /NCGR_PEP_ID=MMETSP0737-20130205/8767_1 /TAXON_ID=385413 /ORGANISM="Thalassiosira miniscula, Strain CCMP1093" /LENGTH=526 /DNA_ID=CAMNT_0025943011 /DNA_START=195 /DNA_END=1775 /DNA_ORIENTATION=-